MPNFVLPTGVTTPFGSNEPFRSTKGIRDESYTFAAASQPSSTIDGVTAKLALQPGALLCLITSGGDTGKVGVFQAGVTDGRQIIANFVGINKTFVPWQLDDGDVNVAAVYSASVIGARLLELNAGGAYIAASGTNKTAVVALERGRTLVIVD